MTRIFLFLILNIVTIFSQTVFAEIPVDIQNKFDSLDSRYLSGKTMAEAYFLDVETYVFSLNATGRRLSKEDLIKGLALYYELAWNDKKYNSFKSSYYKILRGRAQMEGKGGEAIFYAQKMDEEIQKNGGKPSIAATYMKCYFHIINKNYEKAAESYEDALSIIQKYPEYVKNNELYAREIFDLLTLNSLIIGSYFEVKDTAKVLRTLQISQQVRDNYQPFIKNNAYRKIYTDIIVMNMQKDISLFLKEYKKTEEQCMELFAILDNNQSTLGDISKSYKIYTIETLIEMYLETGDLNKAAFYIQEYEKMPNQLIDQSYLIENFKSVLFAKQGKTKEAYELLTSALTNRDKMYATLANDMDELLYSHTESEFNKIELEKLEKAKRNRLIIIILISITAVVIIGFIIYVMKQKDKQSNKRITQLNDMVSLQIATMEEVKTQAIKEEQQRLGKELHDGLSATIASIKHRMELLSLDISDIEQKKVVSSIAAQLSKAYTEIRTKSHEWHNNEDLNHEQVYENRIRELIDNALPDNHYKKFIDIDENVLQYLKLDTRIEILRIVQEAIVNIIKHAKAKSISILLYEDINSAILEIIDDGKGFDIDSLNFNKHLGLKSLKERVENISGSLEILSSKKGTELIINFPISELQIPLN